MCLQICVRETGKKDWRTRRKAKQVLLCLADAVPIASTDLALPLRDRPGAQQRIGARVSGRFKRPVGRCSRHCCREADCHRECSLAKKSHDTPPLSDWLPLFLSVHLIGSRQKPSMRKETAEARIANSVARLPQAGPPPRSKATEKR